MIIFGSKVKHKEIGQGQFFCPKCQQMRRYSHRKASRYFSLYFVPLIPLGTLSEYVECEVCHTAFKPEVVQQAKLLKAAAAQRPQNLADLINRLPDRLQAGTPVEFLVRDLTAAGLDRSRAQDMVNQQLGEEHKRCEACGLTYAGTAVTCAECHRPLS